MDIIHLFLSVEIDNIVGEDDLDTELTVMDTVIDTELKVIDTDIELTTGQALMNESVLQEGCKHFILIFNELIIFINLQDVTRYYYLYQF